MSAGEPVRCAYCGVYYGGHLESCYYANAVQKGVVLSRVGCPFCPDKDKRIAELEAENVESNNRLHSSWDWIRAEAAEDMVKTLNNSLRSSEDKVDELFDRAEKAEAELKAMTGAADILSGLEKSSYARAEQAEAELAALKAMLRQAWLDECDEHATSFAPPDEADYVVWLADLRRRVADAT